MANDSRTIAIGDIHGCISALDAVLAMISPQAEDRIVVLGDFVDCGRESAMVIECLLELDELCRLTCLLGNHEEMLLKAMDDEQARQQWLVCGGLATLNSYFFGAGIEVIPPAHLRFLRACPEFFETEGELFFHANYDPSLAASAQSGEITRWKSMKTAPPPHVSGKTVFVGHTEQEDGEVRDWGHVVGLDTAAWRYGWLTAMDVHSREVWQASRFGVPRRDFSPDQDS